MSGKFNHASNPFFCPSRGLSSWRCQPKKFIAQNFYFNMKTMPLFSMSLERLRYLIRPLTLTKTKTTNTTNTLTLTLTWQPTGYWYPTPCGSWRRKIQNILKMMSESSSDYLPFDLSQCMIYLFNTSHTQNWILSWWMLDLLTVSWKLDLV